MKYELPLIEATLVRRYKRFLADVILADGSEITVHCPNTGSMKHCAEPGSRVWLSDSANPARKYRYSWEWVEVNGKYRACINTTRANQLVKEALEARQIPTLDTWQTLQSEPKVDDGRLDFCLHGECLHGEQSVTDNESRRCWVEVKSVTLLGLPEEDALETDQKDNKSRSRMGYFPDAVTARGLKHLHRLLALHQSGERAVLLFCVPHEGIREVMAAATIDPKYAQALREVAEQGVEVMAFSVLFNDNEMRLSEPLPVYL
ncbi:MAG: DNA/RNA nuclease SfsA [Oleibacter sp.]|nr:DNA/RNA nuclease SfsA [Thalassolituus sp.]